VCPPNGSSLKSRVLSRDPRPEYPADRPENPGMTKATRSEILSRPWDTVSAPRTKAAAVIDAKFTHQRHNSAMATIQIRNVPEEVHRTYQVRAAAAGQSLQEYLLAHLVEYASMATPAEIVAEVRRRMAVDASGYPKSSSADFIREDRETH